MKDLFGMMKQVQQLQERAKQMSEELAALEIIGQSGGGMITVTMNGKFEIRSVKIDPSLMKPGEGEIVEDLFVAAAADAKAKVDAQMAEKAKDLTGGLPLPPGFKPF